MISLNDGIHYNWERTLSYDAPVTMVVGAPNKGKTFGIRSYAFQRYLTRGQRFIEVCRLKDTRDNIKNNYLEKLFAVNDEWGARFDFKCARNTFHIREEGEKWRPCGYIVSLSDVQSVKQGTFVNVSNCIMDEAIIEQIDSVHTYKRNEWNLLSRVLDSCVREDVTDEGRARPHLYLLGNAVDLLNPYFQVFGVKGVPKPGYHWYLDKTALLHIAPADEYDEERRRGTLAGIMGSATGYAQQTYGNGFQEDTRYVAPKPARAQWYMAVACLGETYGIWLDLTEGFYYVTRKLPKKPEPMFSLTRADDSPNRIALRKTNRALKYIVDSYFEGAVLFDSVRTREGFLDAMKLFGLR